MLLRPLQLVQGVAQALEHELDEWRERVAARRAEMDPGRDQ
jgi:hypothetical protein